MDSTSFPDRAQARPANRSARAHGIRHLAAAVVALALAGCAARHEFAPPPATAKSSVGQLRFAHGDRTVIGELSLTQSPSGSRLEFTKAGSIVLMRVISDATHLRFEGPLARGTREYARGATLPDYLASWAELTTTPPTRGPKTLTRGGETLQVVLPPLR